SLVAPQRRQPLPRAQIPAQLSEVPHSLSEQDGVHAPAPHTLGDAAPHVWPLWQPPQLRMAPHVVLSCPHLPAHVAASTRQSTPESRVPSPLGGAASGNELFTSRGDPGLGDPFEQATLRKKIQVNERRFTREKIMAAPVEGCAGARGRRVRWR